MAHRTIPLPSLIIFTAALLLARPSGAQQRSEDAEWHFGAPVGDLIPLMPSADPDEPGFRLTYYGARAEAMVGGQLVLFGRSSPKVDFALALGSFLALANLDDRSALPWETLRAGLGGNILLRSRWLEAQIMPPQSALILELGYFHESDHAVSESRYRTRFLSDPSSEFDNGNFSSFEHFKVRLRYQQRIAGDRISLLVAVGGRFFTPSMNSDDRRKLVAAFSGEARFSVRLVSRLFAFVAGFYELLGNDFDGALEGFSAHLEGDLLHYLLAEAGIAYRPAGGHMISLSAIFNRSNGRGIDFPDLRTEWGVGLRGSL